VTPARRSFLFTPLALQAQHDAPPPPFPWRVPEIQTAPFTYPAELDAIPVRFGHLEMLVLTEPLRTEDNTRILDLWEFYVITAPLDHNGTRWNDKMLHGSDPRQGFAHFDVCPSRKSRAILRSTPATGRLTPEK